MIRLAKDKDLHSLSMMFLAMYVEVFGDEASLDARVYQEVMKAHLDDPRDSVFLDDKFRGFFIVRDETEPMTPNMHRYNGIRVYIAKQYRKSPLLSVFYQHLFQEFPDGDILGVTEINSEHIAVLDKRHELIAKVYKLNRN